jgi:hypothetical protein
VDETRITGTVRTEEVRLSPDGGTVEVVAALEQGEVAAGMSLRVCLNRSTSVGFPIRQVTPLTLPLLLLTLDYKGAEEAEFILMFNFAHETLDVVAEGT